MNEITKVRAALKPLADKGLVRFEPVTTVDYRIGGPVPPPRPVSILIFGDLETVGLEIDRLLRAAGLAHVKPILTGRPSPHKLPRRASESQPSTPIRSAKRPGSD